MRLSHPTHWAGHARQALSRAARLRGRPRRVVVVGGSMLPTLAPGDRLIVWKRSKVEIGDVIALPDPRRSGRTLVKRVTMVGPGVLHVAGDNPEASTDSRHFGPVPAASVIGTAVYRYHPASRSGWIGE